MTEHFYLQRSIDDGLQTVANTSYPSFTNVDHEEDYRRYPSEVSSDKIPVSSEN